MRRSRDCHRATLLAGVVALIAIAAPLSARQVVVGPDLIVGDVSEVLRWGTINGVTGYSLGSTACNVGTQFVSWDRHSSAHPVIAQSIYRLKTVDGATRFEQLGISWLKHGFQAANGNLCGTCSSGSGQVLSPGCSDPYSAGLNGSQSLMGPRSEVNPYTGVFPYPYIIGAQQIGNATFKRIPVPASELDPAQHPGAQFVGEVMYVTSDDAAAGNALNNASWRRMVVLTMQDGGWNLGMAGTTRQRRTAIQAWVELDFRVSFQFVDVPGEGRFVVGYRVHEVGDGTWDYEYAVQNYNSHRGARSLQIPFGPDVTLSQIGFHDVDYHSGEPQDGTDWAVSTGGGLSWSTASFDAQPNANALHWGTTYNFRFRADRPPVDGEIQLGLFRPGPPGAHQSITFVGPRPQSTVTPTCPGDANADGRCDGADLSVMLFTFGNTVPPGSGADFNDDGVVNGADLSELLSQFGLVCW